MKSTISLTRTVLWRVFISRKHSIIIADVLPNLEDGAVNAESSVVFDVIAIAEEVTTRPT